MEPTQIKSEGSNVTFNSLLSPKYPANVIVESATTLARVPASVDNSPPLYVPRDSLDDITLESKAKFTPNVTQTEIKTK